MADPATGSATLSSLAVEREMTFHDLLQFRVIARSKHSS
jgi:hypothetical protein